MLQVLLLQNCAKYYLSANTGSLKTMSIVLEDNSIVWPLNLYNRLLESDDIHVDFALQEYVYQIHSKTVERYGASEVS